MWEASECRGSSQSPINIPRSGKLKGKLNKNLNKRSGLPKVTLPPLEFHDYHIAPEKTTLLNNGYTVQMIPKAFKYDFMNS